MHCNRYRKPVYQFSKNGILIGEFSSGYEAYFETPYSKSCIDKSIRNFEENGFIYD